MSAQPKYPPNPYRRQLLGKVHVAAKELLLDDDTYRGSLMLVTGKGSAKDCSDGELRDVIKHFESKGMRPRTGANAARKADHPAARKARALWISLYQLGAIENAAEQALEAFASRQLKVERMAWMRQADCYKLIEALKKIAERHGWRQSIAGLGRDDPTKVLQARLCDAILDKLKAKDLVPADWSLERAAFDLLGERPEGIIPIMWSLGTLTIVAAGLGAKLRAAS